MAMHGTGAIWNKAKAVSSESSELNLCAYGFRGFGGQDGYLYICRDVPLVRRTLMTALSRMPHPVRPNSLIMAPRCSDP
jgi:hypothetical protein